MQRVLTQPIASAAPLARRSDQAQVVWGSHVVTVGGDAPVRIQSMTNTDTVDVIGTAIQVKELAIAGSEMVRITVNTPEAAQAVPYVREQLDRMGIDVPLIGDFHYNGHRLLSDYPACAEALSKYRINPGNVGKGDKHDRQFGQMIDAAMRWNKPVRIGVNWGSLDQELLAALMDENSARSTPWDAKQVMYEALITSAIDSAHRAEAMGLAASRSFCPARSAACRIWFPFTVNWPNARGMLFTWALPKREWAPKGRWRRPPRCQSCCKKGLATRSVFH